MRDKRGFLLAEEALKLILAVISIGILAYLLFSLYNAGTGSKDLGLAKSSLDSLMTGLSSKTSEILVYNPSNWYISSWSKGSGEPTSCSNFDWSNCICICKKSDAQSCVSDGACLENKNSFLIKTPIKIENPPVTLSVDYQAKEVSKK